MLSNNCLKHLGCSVVVLAILNPEEPSEPITDKKKQALIDAGIKLFGQRGFDGVSVREICKEAGTNVAAVSYHFNGKRDLFEACAIYIMGQVRSHLSDVLLSIQAFLSEGGEDPDEALELVLKFVGRMTDFLVPDSSVATQWAPFVTRFRMDLNTPAPPELQDMGSVVLSHLIGIACRTQGQDLRNGVMTQTMIGQVQVFRINRRAALKNLGIKAVGADELEKIKAILLSNVRAIVQSARREP